MKTAVRPGMIERRRSYPDGGTVHLATLFLLGFPTLASFAELGFVCGKYRSAVDVAAAGDVMGASLVCSLFVLAGGGESRKRNLRAFRTRRQISLTLH